MKGYRLLLIVAALVTSSVPSLALQPSAPQKATFLGFRFIPSAEPMTAEEGERLLTIEKSFISKLQNADKYSFVPVPDEMRERIDEGQPIGQCAGCEVDYGKEQGVPVVMWGTVQKVSNLILNLNIYMADVNDEKMIFIKSVDMRGNTDETWEQALNYRVKRYILKVPARKKDK